MGAHPAIRPEAFIRYKFLNSLFLGLSVGAVFVLIPLSRSVFGRRHRTRLGHPNRCHPVPTHSARAVLSTVAGVELVTLSGVIAVLLFPLELALALFIYIGYQITFSLGNYLVRCETLLMVSVEQLRKLDVAKQAGYLLGMGGAWAVYAGLQHFAAIDDRVEQVISLHWVLAVVEIAVVLALWQAFNRDQLALSAPLIRDEQDAALD